MPHGEGRGHAASSFSRPSSRRLFRANCSTQIAAASRAGRTGHAAPESPRLLEFHGLPRLRRAPAVRKLLGRSHASSPRPPHAVPLLRFRREGSGRHVPQCGSDHIQFLGAGSERVENELHEYLPTARIARLDRDSAAGKGSFETILTAFARRNRHPGRHPNDRQGSRHTERNAGGSSARRYRPRHAGFSRRRAKFSATDSSGRPCRPRRYTR